MTTNPRLQQLTDAGVSIWLDDLDRARLTSGGLAELVHDSFVVGVTTNPSIFEKAIVGGAAHAVDAGPGRHRGTPVGPARDAREGRGRPQQGQDRRRAARSARRPPRGRGQASRVMATTTSSEAVARPE